MNTTAQALVFAVASVAAAAALGMGLSQRAATPAVEIVKLERVVVIGQRAPAPAVVAQLPRVVIEGRRAAPVGDLQLARTQAVDAAI